MSNTSLCLLLHLAFLILLSEGRRRRVIQPEYLTAGSRRFYFNTCECGYTGPSHSGRGKREVSPSPSRKRRSVNLSLEVDLQFGSMEAVNRDQRKSGDIPEKPTIFSKKLNVTQEEEEKVTNKTMEDYLRVINGERTLPGEAPWQVMLQNMNNGEICGGSIINRRFILTAAHCTESFRNVGRSPFAFPDNILAVLRQPERCSRMLLSAKFRQSIIQVIDHPLYKRLPTQELVFDFALLKTKDDMSPFSIDLRPICLPPTLYWQDKHIGEYVQISGYGRTTRTEITGKDTTSCMLLKAMTKVIPPRDPKCNAISSHPDVQLCAWDEKTDACAGDSGGPMILHDRRNFINQFLIGVVSYGSSKCAHESAAGIYGRVTRVMKWILLNTQSGECEND